MISISRRQALHLRSVMRRAFANSRIKTPVVTFIGDREGLTVRAMTADAAVECRIPGERTNETINLPFDFLADVEGKKDDDVSLESGGKDQVSVSWQAGNVPQLVKYTAKQPADAFPAMPKEFSTNRPGLLQALHEASQVTDPDSHRFALACVQLQSNGTINATDSRQLLIQQGFTFPWKEDVLIPRSKVFNSPELPQDQPVSVAQSGDWVVLQVGKWTIFLRIEKEGKFPDLSRYVFDPASAKSRCHISKDDLRFLGETLPQLPCEESQNYPVTIDLNGHVALRVRPSEEAKPTEIVLTNSRWSGEPCRVNTNRTYLQRAVRLGLSELRINDNNSPLSSIDGDRHYVWMPLSGESAIPPTADAARIESPAGEIAAIIPHPETPRSVPTVNATTTNTNGAANNGHVASNGHTSTNGHAKPDSQAPKATPRKAAPQDLAALIEQAEQIRTAAHDLMHLANGMVKSLKQHRRQNRAIENTLASIRQLKSLGV